MIYKRQINKKIIDPVFQKNLDSEKCPPCGKPKEKWSRRKDWRCCSIECTQMWWKAYRAVCWSNVRLEAIKRDNNTCIKCKRKKSNMQVDHIRPVALGGDEWDLDNLQTLCNLCHKEKTKKDMKLIAIERRKEIPNNQTRLIELKEKEKENDTII